MIWLTKRLFHIYSKHLFCILLITILFQTPISQTINRNKHHTTKWFVDHNKRHATNYFLALNDKYCEIRNKVYCCVNLLILSWSYTLKILNIINITIYNNVNTLECQMFSFVDLLLFCSCWLCGFYMLPFKAKILIKSINVFYKNINNSFCFF